jgi:hypothetical protein
MEFVEVKSVESLPYKGKVYDLEVEVDHCYTANDYSVHNSAAGSLVNYLLRITDIDPIKHDLLFERFLDMGRKDLPDIDCLHERTAVKMADGSIKELKNIKVGDVVLDHMDHQQKILNWASRSAKVGFEVVVEIVIENNGELGSFICPGHHRMILDSNEVRYAYDLKITDCIKSFGRDRALIIAINKVDISYNEITLCDIQVENSETFQIYPFRVNDDLTAIDMLYKNLNKR